MKQYTRREWEEILLPSEYEALEAHTREINEDYPLTPSEVFDMIVQYKGGIASGYQIRSIISRVYGIELGPR